MRRPEMRKEYLLNRRRALAYADKRLAQARLFQTDDDGYLDRDLWIEVAGNLHEAAVAYRAAGLGLLAGRVAYIRRRVYAFGMAAAIDERIEVRSLWAFFDRLNAATTASREGGRS